jgi:hypothetical protein
VKIRSFSCLFAIALMLTAFGGATARAGQTCQMVKYVTTRIALQQLLASNNFSKDEKTFLLKGVDERAKEIGQANLNTRGFECGLQTVRASILGCMVEVLPSTLQSLSAPRRKTGRAIWGKTDVSRREGAVIGIFHNCRASAAEAFLSTQ